MERPDLKAFALKKSEDLLDFSLTTLMTRSFIPKGTEGSRTSSPTTNQSKVRN